MYFFENVDTYIGTRSKLCMFTRLADVCMYTLYIQFGPVCYLDDVVSISLTPNVTRNHATPPNLMQCEMMFMSYGTCTSAFRFNIPSTFEENFFDSHQLIFGNSFHLTGQDVNFHIPACFSPV